jgi:hypothetical protein
MLILHHLKSPDGLLQAGDQMGSAIRRPKDKVADPRARSLECEHHSTRSWNLATISPTTPAWQTSMGKRLSMDWEARDTAS